MSAPGLFALLQECFLVLISGTSHLESLCHGHPPAVATNHIWEFRAERAWTRPGRGPLQAPDPAALFGSGFPRTQMMILRGALFDSEGPSRCAIKSHNIFIFKHFSVTELLSVGVLIPQHLVPRTPATGAGKAAQSPCPLERCHKRQGTNDMKTSLRNSTRSLKRQTRVRALSSLLHCTPKASCRYSVHP